MPATQKVVLFRATGTSRVPDVTDQTLDQAKAAVEAAGLTITSETRTVTQPGKDGRVIEQQPKSDASLNRGEPVHVVIGKYATPAPSQTPSATDTPSATPTAEEVDVPKVVDQTRDAAVAALEAAGFHVVTTDSAVTDPNQDGMVVDQSPAGGKAPKGSTVMLGVGQAAVTSQPSTTAPTAKKTP